MRLRDAARDGEQQRPGEVRRRLGQHAGRIRDWNAQRGRRGDIDVVEADGVVGDAAQPGRGFEQRAVDALREQREHHVGGGDAGRERRRRQRGLVVRLTHIDRDAGVAQQAQPRLGDAAGHEDAPAHA